MKFTLSWLKRHLDTTATLDAIARRLTMLGLEVEAHRRSGGPLRRLRRRPCARGRASIPMPTGCNLCRSIPAATILQVVCGAPNARAGLKVVLAPPGVVIPAPARP